MPDGAVRQTKAVFEHHMQAYLARDLDGMLSDYTEESALFINTAPEPIKGLVAIGGFFAQVAEMLTPEVLGQFKVLHQVIDGEVAYITWSAGQAFPFVTDTFVVRGDKIAIQTAALYLP